MAVKKANIKTVKSLSPKKSDKKRIIQKADKILKKSTLTGKQKIFCQNYVLDWNGTKAYKLAYGVTNEDTAKSNATRLLTNAYIREYCELIQSDLEKLCGISKAKVINEHIKIAFTEEETEEEKEDIENEDSTPKKPYIKTSDRIRSLEAISKLQGYEAPVKTALTDKEGNNVIPTILFKDFTNGQT